MIQKLHKKQSRFPYTRNLLLVAMGTIFLNSAIAGSWYVNDNSLTGDVFTTAIGDDTNPGTTAAPFATIEFAITSASIGDTIYVDAGTYGTGADINITKSGLVLRGAKYGISAGPEANPVGRGTDETIVESGLYYGQSKDNIVVDGFTIQMGTLTRGIEARGLNSVIINNIVSGTITPFVQQAGILTRGNAPARLHSFLISHNNVSNLRFGIYMDGMLENPSEISYNYVTGCFTSGYVMTASNGHHFKANVAEANGQGLLVQKGGNLIEQSTFTNNVAIGIRVAGTPQNFGNSIVNNFITGSGVGISLTEDDAAATGNAANYNSITGNVLAITSTHTAAFNANCNWYGTVAGGVIAAQITGNVNFNPFLADGIDTDPIEGFQPITTCIVLPVVLTSFTATVKNYDVLLNWQTASEVNSSHFSIERSLDGLHYSAIGKVNAQGFSSVSVNYNFTDNKPVNFDKPTYYRINMVDRDGSSKYTKVISVVLKTNGSFVQSVYPNPVEAGKTLHTSFIAASSQTISISFVNAVGQVSYKHDFQAAKGINEFNITIPADAVPGVNFLLIRSGNDLKKVPVYIH
ncbi:MAG: hypothetical protein ABI402_19970 [Ferruginibacter sp.]